MALVDIWNGSPTMNTFLVFTVIPYLSCRLKFHRNQCISFWIQPCLVTGVSRNLAPRAASVHVTNVAIPIAPVVCLLAIAITFLLILRLTTYEFGRRKMIQNIFWVAPRLTDQPKPGLKGTLIATRTRDSVVLCKTLTEVVALVRNRRTVEDQNMGHAQRSLCASARKGGRVQLAWPMMDITKENMQNRKQWSVSSA